MSFLHHLPLALIFGLLGNTISFMVFLSPMPTFYKIYKKKSTEGYQCIPYVVALFSSMLWILYAFITPDSTFLKTINSFGILVETIYIIIFLIYASKEARVSTMKLLLVLNVAGLGAIAVITFVIAKTTRVRIKILGWVCLIFSLCVFVAPLGVLRTVIRTKSVKYMPFLLSFFLTISAVVWFFYGLVRNDYYVAIPNVLGFSFGIVQMVLYAIYRNTTKCMEDLIKEKKIVPMELLATNTDHERIEAAKLGPNEVIQLRNVNKEGVYEVKIRNVNQGIMEHIKKIGGIDQAAIPFPPHLVVIAD